MRVCLCVMRGNCKCVCIHFTLASHWSIWEKYTFTCPIQYGGQESDKQPEIQCFVQRHFTNSACFEMRFYRQNRTQMLLFFHRYFNRNPKITKYFQYIFKTVLLDYQWLYSPSNSAPFEYLPFQFSASQQVRQFLFGKLAWR